MFCRREGEARTETKHIAAPVRYRCFQVLFAFLKVISTLKQPLVYCLNASGSVSFVAINRHKNKTLSNCKIVPGRFYGFFQLYHYAKAFLVELFYDRYVILNTIYQKYVFLLVFCVLQNSPPLSVCIVSGA